MIIQALYQRYTDLAADPDSGVSAPYFSSGKISYVLDLEADGRPAQVLDIRDFSGKKPIPLRMTVPEQPARANGINPYFLADKAEYFLGYAPELGTEAETAKKAGDARRKYEALKALAVEVLEGVDDAAARAVLAFYEQWDPAAAGSHPLLQAYRSDLDKGIDTNMAFRLRGSAGCIHDAPAVKAAWIAYRQRKDQASEYDAQCLVTGAESVSIARLHDKIKGVRGTQAAGASLVSFNFRSVESYGKEDKQSYNSPVGKMAAFGYTTALNHLLASPRNRKLLGDMTVVFWAGQAAAAPEIEPFFAAFIQPDQSVPAEDAGTTAQIRDAMDRIRQGKELTANMVPYGDTPFYVLAMSPNNARVAVRFFWSGTFGEMVRKLSEHAADMALTAQPGEAERTPTIGRILAETLRTAGDGKKVGEVPRTLEGEMFRAVIQGTAYPHSLYTGVLNRVRADGEVNRLRVSIVKAYLTRYSRLQRVQHLKEGLTMSLNTEAKEPAYRLGRLFAVLERAQQEAAGGPNRLNATIKDRYFNAAASNPGAVFPLLIKLAQHHMSKSKFGHFRDGEMQEILGGVTGFPANLDLQRQGLFILGYYHQKQHAQAGIRAAVEARDEAAAAESAQEAEAAAGMAD